MTPTPINRLPNGLLGFLGIKNGGRYPDQMGTTLAPTWDLSDLYLGTNVEVATNGPNATGTNFVGHHTVPQGQIWYVFEFGVFSTVLIAGQALRGSIAVLDSGQTVTVPATAYAGPAAAPNERFCCTLDRPIILLGGDTIGFLCTTLTAGPIQVFGGIRFARMQV